MDFDLKPHPCQLRMIGFAHIYKWKQQGNSNGNFGPLSTYKTTAFVHQNVGLTNSTHKGFIGKVRETETIHLPSSSRADLGVNQQQHQTAGSESSLHKDVWR